MGNIILPYRASENQKSWETCKEKYGTRKVSCWNMWKNVSRRARRINISRGSVYHNSSPDLSDPSIKKLFYIREMVAGEFHIGDKGAFSSALHKRWRKREPRRCCYFVHGKLFGDCITLYKLLSANFFGKRNSRLKLKFQ